MFSTLPATAAWRHVEAREGFESVFLRPDGTGVGIEGHTAAVEDGQVWVVRYLIRLDERWVTRSARVWGRSAAGEAEVVLESDGAGNWHVDGTPRPDLAGCVDVDLEASACTNTAPVHRLALAPGEQAAAPAVYVRAVGLGVDRLDQEYRRIEDDGQHRRYDYRAPRFDYADRLVYDEAGLVVHYPGLASRHA